jgi:hypothetical protein
MINAITNVNRADPASVAQAKPAANSATSSQQPTQSKTASPAGGPVDTVQLSNAALAAQELLETSAQTTKEAYLGDHQAQRLLAREAAAEKGQ